MTPRFPLLMPVLAAAALAASLSVARADPPPEHSASVGAAISDTATTARVKERLAQDERLANAKISVTTNDGVVILTGTAPSADASDAAEQVAEGVKGVKSVDNQIAAPSKLSRVEHKVSDDWITTKVKTQLITDRSVMGDSNISVSTSAGVVHLTGTAVSKDAYNQAKSVAQNVKGVRSVDTSQLHLASSN
jgi:hyperosmotically inducible periplasmic protein